MTTNTARANANSNLNQQLRTVAVQMALQSRQPSESIVHVIENAKLLYDFMREPTAPTLKLVSGMGPGGEIPDLVA